MVEFTLGSSGQRIIFSKHALVHFSRFRQLNADSLESGGQLFAELTDDTVNIVLATGPRPTDKRERTVYIPNRKAEQVEIDKNYSKGLHFVGDWHTHPELKPTPSIIDKTNMKECFARSEHSLNFFVLAVIGNSVANLNFSVSFCNATECYVGWSQKIGQGVKAYSTG